MFYFQRIDAGKNECKICSRNFFCRVYLKLIYPRKGATFEALVVKDKSVNVPKQNFHAVATPTEKHKEVAAKWTHSEMVDDQI